MLHGLLRLAQVPQAVAANPPPIVPSHQVLEVVVILVLEELREHVCPPKSCRASQRQ
uniref:Uncharacterized protein n=1 Tax=Amphimedon queenslandica TaxID=400682 RepID=A0A1X7V4U1_AMPQE